MTPQPTAADGVFDRIKASLNGSAVGPDGHDHDHAGTDLEPRAKCRDCGEYKPITEFGFRSGPGSERRTDCRHCNALRQQDRRIRIKNGQTEVVPLTARQRRAAERHTEVRRLHKQGLTYAEIAEKTGVSISTIQQDATDMGLRRTGKDVSTASSSVVKLIDNVTTQLDALADLVHDGRHVIVDLEGVDIPWETKAEWRKRLSHLGRAMRYIRTYT